MLKSSTYGYDAINDADHRAGDGVLVFPFFAVVSVLGSVVSNFGWILLGTIMIVTGYIRLFTKIALLESGLYRFVRHRSPPSTGAILIGLTMIFAGSMGLFTGVVRFSSGLRKQLHQKPDPAPLCISTVNEMDLSEHTPTIARRFRPAQAMEANWGVDVCPVCWEAEG